MNRKTIFAIVILAFIAIVTSLTMNFLKEQKEQQEKREVYLNTTYVKFVPTIVENPDIGYVEVPNLDVKQENLIFVLDHFHETWKIENGEIYITRKLALDKDLVWNYTLLAMDERYIEQWK